MSPYRRTYICLDCRIGWKGSLSSLTKYEPGSTHCGRCGCEGIDMGYDFHTPKKTNKNQWRKIRLMVENNENWLTCGCNGPGEKPKTLAQAKQKYVDRN